MIGRKDGLNMKNEERISTFIDALEGLSQNEWAVLKEIVDREYNRKAAKIKLDGQSVESIHRAKDLSPIQ
jgi:FixJ family two-component response regulator